MALTPSTMLPLGTVAPSFCLMNPSGKSFSLDVIARDQPVVVAFLCNHCPFVKHIRKELATLADAYIPKGIAFIGINANDAAAYPADSPEKMADEALLAGYHFPYLYDETQEVAKAYHAACTPDFFLFDEQRRLVYRGQFDASRPGNDIPVSGEDLKAAMDAVLAGQPVPETQQPSIGCNIKWRSGNEPDYFNT